MQIRHSELPLMLAVIHQSFGESESACARRIQANGPSGSKLKRSRLGLTFLHVTFSVAFISPKDRSTASNDQQMALRSRIEEANGLTSRDDRHLIDMKIRQSGAVVGIMIPMEDSDPEAERSRVERDQTNLHVSSSAEPHMR